MFARHYDSSSPMPWACTWWVKSPMLPPITVEARLSDSNWKLYRSMRDDMVTWLGKEVSVSRQAIVKMLRLCQITSGFLGGLEEMNEEDVALPFGGDDNPEPCTEPMPQWLRAATGVKDEEPTKAPSQVKSFGGPFDQEPVEPGDLQPYGDGSP